MAPSKVRVVERLPGAPVRARHFFFMLLLLPSAVAAQETGTIAGRVLDDESGHPVAGMRVGVRDTGLSVSTDVDGSFRISGVPVGERSVLLWHVAYGEVERTVNVPAGDTVRLELGLERQAVELDALTVEGVTEDDRRRTSSGSSMSVIRRATIEDAARMGLSLGELLQESMAGVQVREGDYGLFSCVEYRGSVNDEGGCSGVAVYMDGVPVGVPGALFAEPVGDIQQLEILSPGQAGVLYGSDGVDGVLLIETQRRAGSGSARGPSRELMSGFDWSAEPLGYRWGRVAGASLLGNAAGLGLSALIAQQCFESFRSSGNPRGRAADRSVLGIRSTCSGLVTFLSGFLIVELPGLAGSYAARWGGTSERSEGRIMPSMLLSTFSATAGYFLIVHGQARESDAAVTAGRVILTLGTPALLTLADRTLRVLR